MGDPSEPAPLVPCQVAIVVTGDGGMTIHVFT